MTPDLSDQVVMSLISFSLVSLLAIVIFAAFLGFLFLRRHRTLQDHFAIRNEEERAPAPRQYRPSFLDQSSRWLAIKGCDMAQVQAALGLHNPMPCSWDEVLTEHAGQKLFISPPVRGWILVVGQALPDPSEDVDRCFYFISRISRSLGNVQFYSVDRPCNYHAWVRAEMGQIRRAYAWAGKTLWNQGALTQAEIAVGCICFGYGESPEGIAFSGDVLALNTEKVKRLAAKWSFDPASIELGLLHDRRGVAGEMIHSRQH